MDSCDFTNTDKKKGEHASYFNMVQVLDFEIRFQLSDRSRFSFVFGHNWKDESAQRS